MAKKRTNPRYDCKGCNAKNTRNQLMGSNGHCIHCKTPMHHTSWMGGQTANLAQLIRISPADETQLKTLSDTAEIDIVDLIRTGVLAQLNNWLESEDPAKAARADVLIQKLGQR